MNLLDWVNAISSALILLLALLTALFPLLSAWKTARGTALRPMLIWASLAIGLAIVSQLFGLFEPLDSGRPWLGRFSYLSVLASLASLLTVLNARTPGAGAWALLMVMLFVVFLIPWLEEPGRFRLAQGLRVLRLDAPWTFFFILIAGMGVTNYLPTRYGPASFLLGIGFVLEYLSLTRLDWSPPARLSAWSGFSWCLTGAIWTAYFRATTTEGSRLDDDHPLNRTWLWFRDHWGVVWGLRTAERFNKSAELARWPCRLNWFGVVGDKMTHGKSQSESLTRESEERALSTLQSLLRRFVLPERLYEVINQKARSDD